MFYKIREITQVSVLFTIPRFFFRIRKIDNFLHLLLNNKGNKAQFVANYAIYNLKRLNDLIFFPK